MVYQNDFIYFKKIFIELTKLGLFNFEINKDTRMSQLTWTYANSSDVDKQKISIFAFIKYIDAANNVDLEFDTNIEPDKSRQYEFEYTNMNIFPGEHYRMLVGIINTENFKNFIEIGTGSGIASKAILNKTNADINTFDIIPWKKTILILQKLNLAIKG